MWYDISHYLVNKILASQNNSGMAVLPDPFSTEGLGARLVMWYDTIASQYLVNKILASQNNSGIAVLPDPFSRLPLAYFT